MKANKFPAMSNLINITERKEINIQILTKEVVSLLVWVGPLPFTQAYESFQ